MKKFLAGFVTGCLLLGAVTYFVYLDGKRSLDAASAKIVGTQAVRTANSDMTGQDANTLAARLLNRQLEELTALNGQDFDGHYVMLLNTMTSNLETISGEARKRASSSAVRAVADKAYVNASTTLTVLIPMRSQFGLVHDD